MKVVDVSMAEDGKNEKHIHSCICYKAIMVIQAIFRSCLKQHLLPFLCLAFISNSCTILTHCRAAVHNPSEKNLYSFVTVFMTSYPAKRAALCLLPVAAPSALPAQTFAKRERLPPIKKNGTREVGIRELLTGWVYLHLKASPWEVPFQTPPSEGISSLVSYKNEAYTNSLTLCVYLFPSAFKNLRTHWPIFTKPSQMQSSQRQ